MRPDSEAQRIQMQLQSEAEGVIGRHGQFTLRSAFQPIISLSHCRSVGYEALVRATHHDGSCVSPHTVFASVADEAELVRLDRLCRALHIHNFMRTGNADSWLFLNVHPIVSVRGRHYGRFFEDLLAATGLPPERVVIEILEDSLLDDRQLADAVAFYRNRGCLVAIDDFGIGHSNFARIWQIKPHIAKLDRSTLLFARRDATARRVLPGLVKLLHEAGCLVLMEGIEDGLEAQLAMESGADLAQGYYFAQPEPQPRTLDESSAAIRGAVRNHRVRLQQHHANRYAVHAHALHRAAADIASDHLLGVCIDRLLSLEGAERCYLIDHEGRQIGGSKIATGRTNAADRRFRPLEDASNAVWIRRSYWECALCKPDEVHTSHPYLSVATGRLCVTLSICFKWEGLARVLCLDVEYAEPVAADLQSAAQHGPASARVVAGTSPA